MTVGKPAKGDAPAADPSRLESICRDVLVAHGRREWLENSGCAARGSFASGGFRLDQGGRVLLAQGSLVLSPEDLDDPAGSEVESLLGALALEMRARGAEPVGLVDSLRIATDLAGTRLPDTTEVLRRRIDAAAERLGLGVFGGECGRSLSDAHFLLVVVIGVLPRVPRRDREKWARAGDRVYRVSLRSNAGSDREAEILALGHALREACQDEVLSWVGSCRDGGLLAAADWLETTGMGLHLSASGSGLGMLTEPNPEAFLLASLAETTPQDVLPASVQVLEVGAISDERWIDLETADGSVLRLRPEEIRRDQRASDFVPPEHESLPSLTPSDDYEQTLLELLPGFRSLCSRDDVCRQPPPEGLPRMSGDSAVLRLGARRDLLLLATGSAQSFSTLDPYIGACLAVCRVTRALAAAGAESLGLLVTMPGEISAGANLVYEGLRHAADGLGTTIEMATAAAGASTIPAVVALGRPAATRLVPARFQSAGHQAFLLGRTREELAGSVYDAHLRGGSNGTPPWVDLGAERRLQDLIRGAAESNLLQSALSLTSGGLVRAAMEACGVDAPTGGLLGLVGEADESLRPEAWLFAESPSRVLVSVAPEEVSLFKERARRQEVPIQFLGEIGGDQLEIRGQLRVALESLRRSWHGSTG